MIQKILDWAISKSGFARPERWLKDSIGASDSSYSGIDVTPDNAMQVAAVAACVRLLSESVASLPLFVYERDGENKRKASGNPYGLLHDSPNEYQTSHVWRQTEMARVLLRGNSYSVIERDSSRRLRALWPLDPDAVTPRTEGGELSYTYWNGGTRRQYHASEIVHFRGPSYNGISGVSILGMARQGIGQAIAETQFGSSLYKNRARPGVVLKYKEMLTQSQREIIESFFMAKFAGALNAGKVAVLEGGMDIESVGFSAEDAQFLQSRAFSVQEIARWFRVPPHLIGDPTRLAYSSSETEMLAFLTHTLRPWLVNFEAELNAKLFQRSNLFAEFSVDGIARGDQASRYEAYSKGLAAGFLTVADVRRWENLPEIDGTDQLLRPVNMTPANGGSNGN